MVNDIELPRICEHCAVRVDNFIVIIGGAELNGPALSTHAIWTYNLYTDKWKKHVLPKKSVAPEPFASAVAVAIEGILYTFGGYIYESHEYKNELWTLCRTKTRSFTWSSIKYQLVFDGTPCEGSCKKEYPSPRKGHTGWEYAGKLWIFGGKGPSPQHYLNDHGYITGDNFARNNQLLSYDANSNKWTNPECFGEVPLPQACHSSTIVKEKVWLFGGYNAISSCLDDFFQLNMHSLTWTRVGTGQPRPGERSWCTLTATADNQLVLHGDDTWIMDLTSHSWRQYTSEKYDQYDHTATLSLNSNVIVIGGYFEDKFDINHTLPDNTFHVMLEPKSLQQLAAHTIYKHQANLSWRCLPKKLIARLGISDQRQSIFIASRVINNL